MRLVLQRVSRASVEWSAAHPSAPRSEEIGPGLLLLVGVGPDDTEADARRLAAKVAHLRLFADPEGRSNLSLLDTGGQALVVSQFTLYADLSRGRRPSFIGAAEPGRADQLYGLFTEALRGHGIGVKTGSFGARMGVTLTNDGPVTLALSTDSWPTSV
ncbi:MAG TPA: D-aminoacyl-tRNA deacylase [Candidatus Acidoferrales bacterium]|nr:D-aminoacyl-tRNA deacylase [Candidatus Acidoferrales bacterium]